MFKRIRTWIGVCLVSIGAFILPKKKEDKPQELTTPSNSPFRLREKSEEGKVIPFTDIHSYIAQLKEPGDQGSACISICNQLKDLSKKKKSAVRLNFSISTIYDKTGQTSSYATCNISGFNNGRWYKLRELNVGVASIITLVEEMIGAMGQDGWGCMNDSIDQLNFYLSRCLKNSQAYVADYCKRMDSEAMIRVQISLVVDEHAKKGKELAPPPQILSKISVRAGKDDPVESAHYIYFRRKHEDVIKTES